MNFQWKNSYLYGLLMAATLISFIFFSEEKILLPKWGTMFGFLFFAAVAMVESWEAWKRRGSIIISDLGIGKGGSTGFNPSGDLRIARSTSDQPSLAVIATGGFVYAGFSMNGNENFIICPPEHVMEFGGNKFVKTHLRNVKYSEMPKYIQDELNKLPRFKKELVARKHNLWFGLTSSYYGTDTVDNFKLEQKFLDTMSMTNEYAHMLDDLIDKKTAINRFKNAGEQSKYKIVESWKDEE